MLELKGAFSNNYNALSYFRSMLESSFMTYWLYIYRVSQKKRNGGFSVHCELKVLYIFISLDRISSAEENGTKIIKFDSVVLILCTFLEIRSFSNFARFLGRMSEEYCRDRQSIRCPVEAHCSVFLLLPQKHRMEGLSCHNSPLIGRKNPAKFENDHISRNGHRI